MCDFRGETVCSLINKCMGEISMLKHANGLWVSVVKWLATRNLKLIILRFESDLETFLFVHTFLLIVLFFLSLCFLSLIHFFSFVLFYIFSALFGLHVYSFQVYFKFSLRKIRHDYTWAHCCLFLAPGNNEWSFRLCPFHLFSAFL